MDTAFIVNPSERVFPFPSGAESRHSVQVFFPIQSTLHCPRHSHEALHLDALPLHLLPSTSLSNGFYLRKRKQALIHIPLKTIRRFETRYKSFELVSRSF